MFTAIALAVTLLLDPPITFGGLTEIPELQFEYFRFEGSGMYQIAGTIGNSKISGTCSLSIAGIKCDLYFRGMFDGGSTFVPSLMILNADLNFTGTALLCVVSTGKCNVTIQVRQK